MVKFEVDIPDEEWQKQVLNNRELHDALEYADVDVSALQSDSDWFNEVFGFVRIERAQINMLGIWTVVTL